MDRTRRCTSAADGRVRQTLVRPTTPQREGTSLVRSTSHSLRGYPVWYKQRHSFNPQITLPPLDNPFSKRVDAIINYTRTMRRGPYWPQLYLVREDGDLRLRTWVLSMLMLDRADQAASYQQFLANLREKVRPRLATSPHRGRSSLFGFS